jgi:small subunit ribosomal protein S7
MSRRSKPEKREIIPDARYNSVHVQSFINRILRDGKKSLAAGLIYDAFEMIEERTKRNPVEVFEQALKNVGPVMEVRPRRVGGATYQVPMEVPAFRRFALATRWLISAAKSRSGKTFSEKLAAEFMDAANNQGAAIRKREEVHKMAEANRAFSHYRA